VQGTESKGIICLNNHALIDFFSRRCCKNSQFEIRDMANKMLKICREAQPDIFEDIGAPCIKLKYCPENTMQNKRCIGKIPTHNDITKAYYGG
jgi:thymidylate synthase (FAD)